jgi:hypothetical protein
MQLVQVQYLHFEKVLPSSKEFFDVLKDDIDRKLMITSAE